VHVIQKTKWSIDPHLYVTLTTDLGTRNLQLVMYAVKHFDHTSHIGGAFDPLLRAITPESIADLSYQRKQEEYDTKETMTLPKLTLNGSCMSKSFKALDELLRRYHGISGAPLSYIVRNKCNIKRSQDDPPFGSFHSTYFSYDEEMICQAPISRDPYIPLELQGKGYGHYHIHFTVDMKKVW
jgi:hypothetical protein